MLDPRRWGGAGQENATGTREGYTREMDSADVVLWEDEDQLDAAGEQGDDTTTPATTSSSPQPRRRHSYDNLQLLLSLDVTLELIHAARESLKRLEIFAHYPGTYGVRVRETIEEVAGELLGVLGERHVRTGFEACVVKFCRRGWVHLIWSCDTSAITQMRAYQPPALSDSGSDTEKPAPASTSVAPLVQFFELVHIGDMIQSIVQVYFNKELVRWTFFCKPYRCSTYPILPR